MPLAIQGPVGVKLGFFDNHLSKIEFGAPSGCWLWNACANGEGYGAVRGRGRGKMRRAHREAYEAENGEGSADGLVVRHKCDTPACVNPSHLEIGTKADNNRDMIERGRHVAPKGSANGNSKLTEADVLAIRAVCVPGCRTNGQRAAAKRYGVDHALIGRIIRREIWAHVL